MEGRKTRGRPKMGVIDDFVEGEDCVIDDLVEGDEEMKKRAED